MKVRILFDWAGNIYDWVIKEWPLPFFPSKGDSFAFREFVEDGIVMDYKDIEFIGKGRYEGLETSIMGMLQNDYHTIIKNIKWSPGGAEIELVTKIYDRRGDIEHFWEEK